MKLKVFFYLLTFFLFINFSKSYAQNFLIIGDSNINNTNISKLLTTNHIQFGTIEKFAGDIQFIYSEFKRPQLKQLQNALKQNLKCVFILIGTNDLFLHNRSIDQVTKDYVKFIKFLSKYENVKNICTISLLPISKKKNNQKIIKFNNQLKKIGHNTKEKKVLYFDIYNKFTIKGENLIQNETFFSDGLHLNKAGYYEFKKILHSLMKF